MIDLDSLEKQARTHSSISASSKWVMAVVREIRGNRERIAALEADNVQLRTELARSGIHTTTTKTTIIRGGRTTVTHNDADFPSKEMDEAMGFVEKAMGSLDRMFGKLGAKK
jgi:hypothetical protein